MAEEFGFYDPVLLPDGTYDREYNAKVYSIPFKALINTGVMKGEMNDLAVTSNGLDMVTKIDTGIAFINGRYYKNTSFKTHQHDTESLGVSRIDRIVIRMNEETDYRSTLSYVKKGAPSANPVPPTLVQTESVYEISLAQVKIVGGQTFIATNAVTDERGKDVICPWAGSNILPSFDDNALATHMDDFELHTPYVVTTGTTTAYDVNLGDSVTSLVEGMSFAVKIHATNTGFAQINVNGLGAKYVANTNASLAPKDTLIKDMVYTLRYNGNHFIVQGSAPFILKKVVIDPWSGWSKGSTYSIYVAKNEGDKLIYVRGELTKTSGATQILAQLPAGYRPSPGERVAILITAPISGTFKSINGYLTDDGMLMAYTLSEINAIANGSSIYFNFSFIYGE